MSDLTTVTLDAALSEIAEWITAVNYEQAIARCNELISSYPDAVRIYRARAQAFELSADAARGIDDYTRVLEIAPADQRSMVGLARCYLSTDQPQEALVVARQALDCDPKDVDALQIAGSSEEGANATGPIASARSWFTGGLTNRAIAEVRRMNAAEPDRTDVQVVLAEMLWRSGFKVTTVELCQHILDAQPDCLNAHVILSALWSQMGNIDVAKVHSRAVERFDPDYRETRIWLGEAAPFPVRDVPAHVEPKPQPDLDAAEKEVAGVADEERDRSAWVDELIAAAGPLTPAISAASDPEVVTASGGTPATATPAGVDANADVYAGEIEGTTPLEWTPANAGENSEDVPEWLVALRTEAAKPVPADASPDAVADTSQTGPVAQDVPDRSLPVPLEWTSAVSEEAPPVAPEPLPVVAAPVDAPATPPVEPIPTAVQVQADMPAPPPVEPPVEVPQTVAATESTPAPVPAYPVFKPQPRKPARKAKSQKAKPTSDDLLALAREAVQSGRYDEAADHYASLISSGKKLDVVQADLDVATQAYPDVRRFHALLGDVYTRKGDVNAALMAYHRALENS